MGSRSVKWNKRALWRLDEIAQWYEENVGVKARNHFLRDTMSGIRAIQAMPEIGTPEPSKTSSQLYSFLTHPLIRVAYKFTDTTLTIVAIRCTRMKNT